MQATSARQPIYTAAKKLSQQAGHRLALTIYRHNHVSVVHKSADSNSSGVPARVGAYAIAERSTSVEKRQLALRLANWKRRNNRCCTLTNDRPARI
jgi:hypothetical protein